MLLSRFLQKEAVESDFFFCQDAGGRNPPVCSELSMFALDLESKKALLIKRNRSFPRAF
ncbi:hypothetical protein B4113_0662 [Geobacillus sp. B4113_201601]|nr:hypothetical protein B4113_0662 [Geobacillus sp. B4113_201601]